MILFIYYRDKINFTTIYILFIIFFFLDTSLLIKLKREDCWTYLIETNCVEGLLVWLGMKQPPHQFPWPTDLFNQWTITQEMTDSVHNLNCTESTKEILFNSLAL